MLNKIFLISIVVGFLLCSPVNATNLIVNGDFETDDFTNWTDTGIQYYSAALISGITYPGVGGYNSQCSACLYDIAYEKPYFYQSIDLTNVDTITFYLKSTFMDAGSYVAFGIGSTSSIIWSNVSVHDWEYYEVDVAGYSGTSDIYFHVCWGGVSSGVTVYIDDITAEAQMPSTDYITWDTFPSDSWKVGNYSTLMVGVPASLKNFTFFYKTPSTDYTEMPIQKHFIHKTFNVEEGEFYYYYAKFPYHATYGNYSAKIELNEAVLDSKSVIVPYFDPDITLPDTVIIPIPEVFVDPPQWNVTIPEEYGNVTWLTDYTAFCDGIGNSMNYTTYATVGLLLIPLEMLNGSVTTVHEYATDAAGMVTGFEHCSIIIKAAWAIIPSEIQTLFVGAAALGLVVFLYHRRA